jgi:protein-glutamine gamma-glutamyltransferase
MKAPRFFLGTIVLFWGWQMQTLWIAICLAAVLESSRVIKSKFEFKSSDFNKFVDISIVFLAGIIVISLTLEPEKAILIILKWLPLVFFPVIAAQEFSVKGTIESRSFFIVQKKRLKTIAHDSNEIDISFPYSLFCILSTATANSKGLLFYSSVVLFFAWGLFQIRSKRVSFFLWMLCIFITIFLGYVGHSSIRLASLKINQWMMEYYAGYYADNPFKNHTALGEIGKLKLSDKIILRASFEDYIEGKTYLLHTASYTGFSISSWFARYGFKSIENAYDKTFWQINSNINPSRKMTFYLKTSRENAVLSLPSGTFTISDMKIGACEKNAMQSVRIKNIPPLIKGVVSYTGRLSYEAPPDNQDLLIPKSELSGIAKIVKELALDKMSEQDILNTIQRYFLVEYKYSLDLKGKQNQQTPLQNFLNHTKSGHCEFFATATTLILRQAKIPARYATGYMAHEYSRLGNHLVIRQRDAHAWAKVYVNGQWKNFDTTPPSFFEIDRQKIKSSLISDFFSFISFKLSLLRHETGADLMKQYGLWLILPLVLILFFRLRRSNRIKRIKFFDKPLEDAKKDALDISFHLIEKKITQQSFPRYPYETYFSWLERIEHNFDKTINNELKILLQAHNRYYFSHSGLSKDEKRKFTSNIKKILKRLTITPIVPGS